MTKALSKMHRFNIFILLATCLSIWPVNVSYSLKTWDFNFLRVESNTTNPEIVQFNLRMIRTKSGMNAVNGTFSLGIDFNNSVLATLDIYRSSSGSSDYRRAPYEIEATPLYKFMTIIYVKFLQKEFQNCSNMPVHDKEFDTPMKKGTYYMNMCLMSNERMPGHMPTGFYMVAAHFFLVGYVDAWLTGYGEVFSQVVG